MLKELEKFVLQTTIWTKLLVIVIIVTSLYLLHKTMMSALNISTSRGNTSKSIEGFQNQQSEAYVLKKDDDKYDNFYVSIYDQLFYNDFAVNYELGTISNLIPFHTQDKILDMGSTTGHTLGILKDHDYKNVIGLEPSQKMIKESERNYPQTEFVHGKPTDSMLFQDNTFNNILCLQKTIYRYRNKREIFQNAYNWLEDGGHFMVHVVDKDMFDPVLNIAKPFILINPQSVAKKRITKSYVSFEDFTYEGDFQVQPIQSGGSDRNEKCVYKEVFKPRSDSEKVREHQTTLWIPPKEEIKDIAIESGFILKDTIDLILSRQEYQYIYVFEKPM
jgi:SAM-dependent methyltransferase